MPVTITLKQLRGLKACRKQLNLFEEVFGESVSFKTKAQAIKVAVKMANKFDFDWASENLLDGDYSKVYEEAKASLGEVYKEAVVPLWRDYEGARDPFWKAYEEAAAPLWKHHKEAIAPLWRDYEEAIAPLRKAHRQAIAPLWREYKESLAKEFAKCYFDQEEQNRS